MPDLSQSSNLSSPSSGTTSSYALVDYERAKFSSSGGTVAVRNDEFQLFAGEDLTNDVQKVENRYAYSRALAGAAGTTTVKSGAGFLHTLVVNKAVATGTVTIYDSAGTSATIIGQIITGAALVSDPPLSATYDVSCGTGLTIASAQAFDITVSYR